MVKISPKFPGPLGSLVLKNHGPSNFFRARFGISNIFYTSGIEVSYHFQGPFGPLVLIFCGLLPNFEGNWPKGLPYCDLSLRGGGGGDTFLLFPLFFSKSNIVLISIIHACFHWCVQDCFWVGRRLKEYLQGANWIKWSHNGLILLSFFWICGVFTLQTPPRHATDFRGN